MIVFYTFEKSTITLLNTSVYDSICPYNCINPKNKCCFKYKIRASTVSDAQIFHYEKLFDYSIESDL